MAGDSGGEAAALAGTTGAPPPHRPRRPNMLQEIGIVSGLPHLDEGRKVTIYSPARTAGQQGISQTAAGAYAGCGRSAVAAANDVLCSTFVRV